MGKGIPCCNELRGLIIIYYEEGKKPVEIMKILRLKKDIVYRTLARYKTTGKYEVKPWNGGRPPGITEEEKVKIKELIEKEADIELGTIKKTLNISVSIPALCNTINYKMKLPRKKKRYMPASSRVMM